MESLLAQILEEQRKTNELLLMLIEAMGQDDGEVEVEPQTYLSGEPVR